MAYAANWEFFNARRLAPVRVFFNFYSMRKTLFSLLFLLTIQQTFAAALSSRPASIENAGARPPHRRWVYEKKGTMGYVAAVLLGPIGYFGVRLFTHSEPFRYQAKRGLTVWICIVVVLAVSAGICLYAAATKTDGSQSLGNFFSFLSTLSY